ncbi:MAG: hypothetical protein NUV78_00875 [Candidatus Zambryskibacteria bacterium]|nr:hypothetical protein [Candidatus Zambryskibacteria bacterium]
MSDDIKTPVTETPVTDTSKKQESAPEKVSSFYGGKYKSQDEFEAAYKSLESKLGEQGEKIKQADEFATYVQPIIDLARTDTEVFEILDKKLRKDTKNEAKPEKADQMELRNATSDLLLARFESEHGIDKLPSDDAAKVRREIGAKVAELSGQQLGNVDLRRLTNTLENAYRLVKPKSSPESETDDGSIPSISSSPGKSETTLSSEEATVAQGLGLSREEYLSGKKGLAKKYK